MSVIRGTGLTNFRTVMRELGVDPDPVLDAAGVRPQDAGDHGAFVSYRGLVIALERAAEVTATPDFGRRLALRQGIEILGPVGVAARTASTTGEALRTCSTYLGAYSPAITVQLLPVADVEHVFLEFQIVEAIGSSAKQAIELSLGVALQVVRYLRGNRYRPVAVHFPHAPLTDESEYGAYFACQPSFETAQAGLMLRASDLDEAVSRDAQAHEAVTRYLDTLVASAQPGLLGPVRRLVRDLLPTGTVSMDRIAHHFALHPKTLQRRLADDGTTFAAVVQGCRRELTEHYLRDTDLSLSQVAREIGYAEQSVLTRSCARWYGCGPAALRRSLRSGEVFEDPVS